MAEHTRKHTAEHTGAEGHRRRVVAAGMAMLLVMVVALAAVAVTSGSAQIRSATAGTPIEPPEFPASFHDGTQPVLDPAGMSHSVTRCAGVDSASAEPVIVAQFDSPFDFERSAIVGLSTDINQSGWLWGFTTVSIPPGRSQVVFHRSDFPSNTSEPDLAAGSECGVHLLGFVDREPGGIRPPIVASATTSDI